MLRIRSQLFFGQRVAEVQPLSLQVLPVSAALAVTLHHPAAAASSPDGPTRSMHVLGNIANLVLYFSSPPTHMNNFPAAAACVAASAAAALVVSWFIDRKQ